MFSSTRLYAFLWVRLAGILLDSGYAVLLRRLCSLKRHRGAACALASQAHAWTHASPQNMAWSRSLTSRQVYMETSLIFWPSWAGANFVNTAYARYLGCHRPAFAQNWSNGLCAFMGTAQARLIQHSAHLCLPYRANSRHRVQNPHASFADKRTLSGDTCIGNLHPL